MFNEMLRSRDPDFDDIGKRSVSYVCFNTFPEEFFVVSFDLLATSAFQLEPSNTLEVFKNRMFVFADYLDGQDNGYYSLLISWNWQKGDRRSSFGSFSRNQRDIPGLNELSISDTSVHVVRDFTNVEDADVIQSVEIRRSTLRYSMDITRGDERKTVEGRCLKYPH